jgi:hypothetical protein
MDKREVGFDEANPTYKICDHTGRFSSQIIKQQVIALARRALAIALLTHQTQLIAKVGSQSRKS